MLVSSPMFAAVLHFLRLGGVGEKGSFRRGNHVDYLPKTLALRAIPYPFKFRDLFFAPLVVKAPNQAPTKLSKKFSHGVLIA